MALTARRSLSFVRIRLLAALIASSVALVACGGSDDSPGDAASPPDAASVDLDFQAMTVAGESVDAGTYTGSDLVIWFWAPW